MPFWARACIMSPMSLRSFAASTPSRLAASTTEITRTIQAGAISPRVISNSTEASPESRTPTFSPATFTDGTSTGGTETRNSALFASDDFKVTSCHIAPHVELGPPLADAVRLGSESQPVRQLRPKSAQSGEWRGLQRGHPLDRKSVV